MSISSAIPSAAFDADATLILQVERAASDLRRGQSVRLVMKNGHRLDVAAAEYYPAEETCKAHDHPAVKLMKIGGLLPAARLWPTSDERAEDKFQVSEQAVRGYRLALASTLVPVSEAHVPLTVAENTRIVAFRPRFGHEEHLAVIIGDIHAVEAPLVRLHSSCVTGDMFGSLRCDCGDQLHQALELMAQQGAGVLLYLSQEGRGIGIANKLRAYRLQDEGLDTVEANEALGFEADERDFSLAVVMLKHLGVHTITLVTNNPKKISVLEQYGVKVQGRASIVIPATRHNAQYLATKVEKMGHTMSASSLQDGPLA